MSKDIFDQMKDGAELIVLLDVLRNCGIDGSLSLRGGLWYWDSPTVAAHDADALHVIRMVVGMIGRSA